MTFRRPTTRSENVVILASSLSMLSVLVGKDWKVALIFLGMGIAGVLGLRSSRSMFGLGIGSLFLIVLLGVSFLTARSFVDQHYMGVLYGTPGDLDPSWNPVRNAFAFAVPVLLLCVYSAFAIGAVAVRQSDVRMSALLGGCVGCALLAFPAYVGAAIVHPIAVRSATFDAVATADRIGEEALADLDRSGTRTTVEGFRDFTSYRLLQMTTSDPRVRATLETKLPQSIVDYEKIVRSNRELNSDVSGRQ